MGDIVITYDTLYDVLRREKNTLEIQELEPNFLNDVLEYLKEKNDLFQSKANDHSLFGFGEKKELMIQIENTQKILRELYAIREKKIMLLARDVSLTNNQIVNRALLLGPEKKLFDSILSTLNLHREGILGNLLSLKDPDLGRASADFEPEKPQESPKALNTPENPEEKKIQFLTQVEAFMGPDMGEYGPYEEGASLSLPGEIADMMIKKGYANEIKEGDQEAL